MTYEELLAKFPNTKNEISSKLLLSFNKNPDWAKVMMFVVNLKAGMSFSNLNELVDYIADFIL